MYYLLIDQRDWYDCGYDTVGSFNDRKVIEAEILPEIPYQEITDMSLQIVQSCFPAGFGTVMSVEEIAEARGIISVLGEYGNRANTLNELRLMNEITEIQLALVNGGES